MNLVGKSECRDLAGSEGIVPGGGGEVSRVVECENADVVTASDLETIYAAVGSHDPRCLFRVASDRPHEVEREKADRSGMRKNRDPASDVSSKNFPKLRGAPPKKVPVTLTLGDNVVDISADEGVVILRERLLGFVKGETLENPNVPLAKRGGWNNGYSGKFGKGFRRLDGAEKIAGVNAVDAFFRKKLSRRRRLLDAEA